MTSSSRVPAADQVVHDHLFLSDPDGAAAYSPACIAHSSRSGRTRSRDCRPAAGSVRRPQLAGCASRISTFPVIPRHPHPAGVFSSRTRQSRFLHNAARIRVPGHVGNCRTPTPAFPAGTFYQLHERPQSCSHELSCASWPIVVQGPVRQAAGACCSRPPHWSH